MSDFSYMSTDELRERLAELENEALAKRDDESAIFDLRRECDAIVDELADRGAY